MSIAVVEVRSRGKRQTEVDWEGRPREGRCGEDEAGGDGDGDGSASIYGRRHGRHALICPVIVQLSTQHAGSAVKRWRRGAGGQRWTATAHAPLCWPRPWDGARTPRSQSRSEDWSAPVPVLCCPLQLPPAYRKHVTDYWRPDEEERGSIRCVQSCPSLEDARPSAPMTTRAFSSANGRAVSPAICLARLIL